MFVLPARNGYVALALRAGLCLRRAWRHCNLPFLQSEQSDLSLAGIIVLKHNGFQL